VTDTAPALACGRAMTVMARGSAQCDAPPPLLIGLGRLALLAGGVCGGDGWGGEA
jgi:hypothetical protein